MKIPYLFLLFSISLKSICCITFYEKNLEHNYECNVEFDYPRKFDCACLKGLWRLFGSACKDIAHIGGKNQYCFQITKGEITRAEQLLASKNDLVLEKLDGTLTPLSEKIHFNDVHEFSAKDNFITGSEWSLLDGKGNSLCLKPKVDFFCFFGNVPKSHHNAKIIKGCKPESIQHDPKECVENHSESKNICDHQISKRAVGKPGSRKKGRVFFAAPGHNFEVFNGSDTSPNSTVIYDEDFVNTTGGENVTFSHDSIATEIWNFLDNKIDDLLELNEPFELLLPNNTANATNESNNGRTKRRAPIWGRKFGKGRSINRASQNAIEDKSGDLVKTGNSSSKPYKAPVYQFLELCKDVMIKTCPEAYVKPDFFDLAVTSFIRIQRKHLNFPDSATNYFGYGRILQSLKTCRDNATTFNFTTDPCQSKQKPVSGTYCAFGNCSMEINMYAGFEDFDPLIETVWNIFKNAHAYCFNHFNKVYNDHHRFTTWMIPLFQNQINDIWRNGSAKGIVYGGIFGNQENVQTAVTYCTASSQLTTAYPWDLPRPEKIDELSKPLGSSNDNSTSNPSRRKRHAFEMENMMLLDTSAKCLASENVYACE